jgi:hypothetical protein
MITRTEHTGQSGNLRLRKLTWCILNIDALILHQRTTATEAVKHAHLHGKGGVASCSAARCEVNCIKARTLNHVKALESGQLLQQRRQRPLSDCCVLSHKLTHTGVLKNEGGDHIKLPPTTINATWQASNRGKRIGGNRSW